MKRIAIFGVAAMGLALLILIGPTQRRAQAQDPEKDKLAEKAKNILEKRCSGCHGQTKLKGEFDVRDPKTLLTKDRKGRDYISQAGKEKGLKDSVYWTRIESDSMPEDGPLSDEDKASIKSWIEAGAPLWKTGGGAGPRKFVSQETVLRAIYNDMKSADEEDRPYLRYFTFTNLHNNPTVTEADLARFKAGLSKAFNSMHWKKPIVILRALKGETEKDDPQHTVFAFDLRDVDWDLKPHKDKYDRWTVLLNYYPYGMRYDDDKNESLARLDRDLFGTGKRTERGLANGVLVYIRADWFMAMATRPPVYEKILRLPDHVKPLEDELGVDVAKNFRRNRVARAGFTRSGVSEQHRLIERHDAKYGAYWRSYDFLPDTPDANLINLPLGPIFKEEYNGKFPYQRFAFRHDGGEMIFNLPNGMQGYYLAKADDTYLDVGPIKVVEDKLKISGTPEIVNGLSCMNCHVRGMIDTGDQIREATSVSGEERRKVRRIYLTREKMQEYYDSDAELFQSAAKKAMGPFLKGDELKTMLESRESEPIGKLAKLYNADVNLALAAGDLGYSEKEVPKFEGILEASEKLRELGLAPLVNKGVIKRPDWGSLKEGRSLFQRTMLELGRGSPWNTRFADVK